MPKIILQIFQCQVQFFKFRVIDSYFWGSPWSFCSGVAQDIFNMGSWNHMGRTGNMIFEGIKNIFTSQPIKMGKNIFASVRPLTLDQSAVTALFLVSSNLLTNKISFLSYSWKIAVPMRICWWEPLSSVPVCCVCMEKGLSWLDPADILCSQI